MARANPAYSTSPTRLQGCRGMPLRVRALCTQGAAVCIVSHDVEFCAQYADRCGLLFRGEVVTENAAHARQFTMQVDSAAVYVNCSTRFTDGGEFGLGCEMGISTQKLHARGPMGLEELCSYKYIIHGSGQIR